MKNFQISYLSIFFLFSILFTDCSAADLHLGKPAPDLTITLLDSTEQISNKSNLGKIVIVNFWATWCAPCTREMPAFQAIYSKYHDKGLEIIAINMDELKELPKVRNFIKPYTFHFAHKSDADFKNLGRIWRLPSTFVIDKQGLLRKDGNTGDPEVSIELLESIIAPLLNTP